MKTYKFKMYSNHNNRELQKTIDSHAHVGITLWRCVADTMLSMGSIPAKKC